MKVSNGISSRKTPPRSQPRTADFYSSTVEHFRLTGPSLALDPAIHAFRDDIADIALAGQLFAPHYARPVTKTCGARAAKAHASPDEGSEALYQLSPGEEFAVLDITGAWAWGYRRSDHRVGYVAADCLKPAS